MGKDEPPPESTFVEINRAIGLQQVPRLPGQTPFWKHRYLYVVLLVIATIGVLPVTANSVNVVESVSALYLYAMALLVSVWAARGSAGHMFIVAVLTLSALFMDHMHQLEIIPRVSAWFILTVSFWISATIRVLLIIGRDLAAKTQIGTNEILGAVAIYLFIGTLWTSFYVAEVTYDSQAFYLDPERFDHQVPRAGDLLFFSFATLTTLGYGDITPMSSLARSLAVVESVVGVLFLATLIARFVSVGSVPVVMAHLKDAPGRQPEQSPPEKDEELRD